MTKAARNLIDGQRLDDDVERRKPGPPWRGGGHCAGTPRRQRRGRGGGAAGVVGTASPTYCTQSTVRAPIDDPVRV